MRSSYDLFSNLPTTVVLPKSAAHISECFASWYSSSADAGLNPPAQVSSVPGLLFCNRLWPLTSPEGPGIWVSHWYKRTRRIIWTACHLSSAWMVLMCLNFSTSRGAAEGQTTKSLFERIKRLKKQKTKQLICEGFSQGGKKNMNDCFSDDWFFWAGLWWSTTGGHSLPFFSSPAFKSTESICLPVKWKPWIHHLYFLPLLTCLIESHV